MPLPIPTTCAEAAARFHEWADKTNSEIDRHKYEARADILETFGDAPVPEKLLAEWDFTR
jgi:hypothetical protein